MNYEVKIIDSGRGGTICYLENNKELPFGWEFAINGALLFVPSPQHWNTLCASSDFPQAKNRRDEILNRICEGVIHQKALGAKYEIGDDYISISFG
jgi:hypothetical protein